MKIFKIIILIVILAVLIQFIPYGKDHKNPTVTNTVKWDSPKTKELFYRACADCHSFETKWPKYANIAPVSWFIMSDIQEGRDHFNISKKINAKDIKEAVKQIKEGEMPMWQYTLIHKNARLSDKEKQLLISGLKKTFLNSK